MPNFSGIWSAQQQFQARGQAVWPRRPDAPTIGTATAGNTLCASVTFTPPTAKCYVGGVTSYTVTSTPGCITGSGAASPVTVTGLTSGTSYTFKVKATNSLGAGGCSAASNSITAVTASSQSYTVFGTYTWVVPTGVTSVSAVAVGRGAPGIGICNQVGYGGQGGGGGALSYVNSLSTTPGESLTVVIDSSSSRLTRGATNLLLAQGGVGPAGGSAASGVGCVKYSGGAGNASGGGAAGYSGNGGAGATGTSGGTGAAACSGGGGGGGPINNFGAAPAGGGVGIFGKGATGAVGGMNLGGGGGSGGTAGNGVTSQYPNAVPQYGGGLYGGGGGSARARFCFDCAPPCGTPGGVGAVRIVWPGNTRTFPSTNVGAP